MERLQDAATRKLPSKNCRTNTKSHPTRQDFSNLLLYTFGERVQIVASVSC